MSLLQRAEALDLAALFSRAVALTETSTGDRAVRSRDTVQLLGYLFRIQTEGWVRFCAFAQLDPAAC